MTQNLTEMLWRDITQRNVEDLATNKTKECSDNGYNASQTQKLIRSAIE